MTEPMLVDPSMLSALAMPLAFILDFFLGDPPRLPHPIRWMGRAIERGEPYFRDFSIPLKWSGLWFTVTLVAATWGLAQLLLWLAWSINPWLGGLLNLLMIYYALAVRSLQDAALMVARALGQDDLPLARRRVSMIVGRETDGLDQEGVGRAAVETVAENLVDGVVAPLCYAALGGGPLALAYKMVNTLDSMVGYKNDRYRDFGWASARLDDGANWLPARLAVPLVALAAVWLNGRWREALAIVWRDGRKHTSPNAGLSEAAFAGALAIRLGGPNRYHGMLVDKPWIGEEFGAVTVADVQRSCDLMLLTAVGALIVLWGLAMAAALLF